MAANLRRTKAKLEEQQAAVEALRESSADRIAALEAQLEDARDLAEIGDQTDEALRALLRDAEAANAELRGEIATLEAARLACEAERRSSMEPPAENQLTGPATAEAAATEGPRSAPPEPLPLTVESRPAPDIELAIDTLFAWAEAWSRQSVDDYLSFYSRAFQPPGYESLAEWQAERRDRLIRPSQIEISLSAVQAVFLGEGRVSIRFRQRYRSTSYEDSVVKEMVMEWTDGVWKILRESVVDVLESP